MRKNFTEPKKLSKAGRYLFTIMFRRNITIVEMAEHCNVRPEQVRVWLGNDGLTVQQVCKMCTMLAADKIEYEAMVFHCVINLPIYHATWGVFGGGDHD